MNIEDFRTYCLSFKGVSEKMPFGKASTEYDRNLLVFSVCEWFCFVNVDVFDFCKVICRPEQSEELQERYEGMRPGYHMNKRHWLSFCFNRDVPDSLIRSLVRQSYDLVVASLTRKQREALEKL